MTESKTPKEILVCAECGMNNGDATFDKNNCENCNKTGLVLYQRAPEESYED